MDSMVNTEGLPDGWQEYFDELILERGRQYFKEERVSCLEQTEDGYSAIVEGGDRYNVFVDFSEGLEFECDCPYAEDGNSCKHMAAVCFAIDQTPAAKKKPDVFQLLGKADEEQMRSFLQKNVLVRREFADMFAVWVQKKISPKEFLSYRARMLKEISSGLKHLKMYEYYNEYEYYQEISAAIDASIGLMLKRGFLREGFLLVQAAVNCILEWDSEGMCLDGLYDIIKGDIFSPMGQIVAENTDAKLEQEMFVWLVGQQYSDEWGCRDSAWKILMENFPSYAREKLEALDKMIAEGSDGQLILYKLELMEGLGYSAEDIRRVIDEGWRFYVVRERLFEELYAKGDLRGAGDILLDGRALDVDLPRAAVLYTRRIRDLYEEMGQVDSARVEAREILHASGVSVNDYIEFKRLCSPDEEGITEAIGSIRDYSLQNDILCVEGMHEQLFSRLSAGFSVREMQSYEDVLAEKFPKEILAWYVQVVSRMAEPVGGRKCYAEMADILVWMRRYAGGDEEVNRLLAGWRAVYTHRPAMWDEFRKRGL